MLVLYIRVWLQAESCEMNSLVLQMAAGQLSTWRVVLQCGVSAPPCWQSVQAAC